MPAHLNLYILIHFFLQLLNYGTISQLLQLNHNIDDRDLKKRTLDYFCINPANYRLCSLCVPVLIMEVCTVINELNK